MDGQHFTGVKSFDFFPECVRPKSALQGWPVFRPYCSLLPTINNFLQQHPSFRVKSCETIHFLVTGRRVKDRYKSDFIQTAETLRPFVKGARLWIEDVNSREPSFAEKTADQIGYVTIVPEMRDGYVDTLTDIIYHINRDLRRYPLPGQLVSVETLHMEGVGMDKIEIGASSWKPRWSWDDCKEGHLRMYRLWFRRGERRFETIGLVDFFPAKKLAEPNLTVNVKHKYQRFREIMPSVDSWASTLPGNMTILNTTTLRVPLNPDGSIGNTYQTFSWGVQRYSDGYLRFLRIIFVITPEAPAALAAPPPYGGRHITTRLFVPCLLQASRFRQWLKFELASATKARLSEWVKLTGAQVISLETVALKATTGGEARTGFDAMHTWNEMSIDEFQVKDAIPEQYIMCYRIYIEGDVLDPPGFFWPISIRDLQRASVI